MTIQNKLRMALGAITVLVVVIGASIVNSEASAVTIIINVSAIILALITAIILGLPQDITELRQVELALKETEERKHAILDAALDGIITIDVEGNVVEFNPAAERMFGYTGDEVRGKNLAEFIIPPHLRERHYLGLKRFQQTGVATILGKRIELSAIRANGDEFPIELTITLIDLENRRFFTGFIRDISERKLAEDRLRTLSQAVDQSPASVVITDPEGVIEYVNPKFTQITGYTSEEVIGKKPSILKSGKTTEEEYAQLWKTITAGNEWRGKFCNRKKNGELVWEQQAISPIKGPDGRITHFLAVKEDITDQMAYEERLLHQANFDGLTDLPNRVLVLDRLSQAILGAQRDGGIVALLYLDLDRFKYINDTLGHDFGDRVLIETARRIRKCVRGIDTVGRLGGDEFLVILHDLHNAMKAGSIAGKILAALDAPIMLEGKELTVTASIGIAVYPDGGESPDALLSNADTAMYEAKQQGRNAYRFFTRQMNKLLVKRLRQEQQLHHAMENQEFEVYYQPFIDLNTGTVVGAEALLRWNNPVEGKVPPDEFIPVAEDIGVIESIGEWVLAMACQEAKALCQRDPAFFISVNLSPRQFAGGKTMDAVIHALENTGLAPECLELEIKESLLMKNVDEATRTLEALSKIGIQLAMDDFGAGCSSLSNLRHFPFNVLKIDRTFMTDVPGDPENTALVRAIICMAKSLDMTVIAEGIETAEQLELVTGLGADIGQGYFLGRPMPAGEFKDFSLSGGARHFSA